MAFGEEPGANGADGGGELSVDELEEEITTLSAHLSAATYRLLVLIEAFDRRKGWAGWGVRSCAHWLSWKCGVGMVAAREKVRVARALAELPRVSEAMAAGRLSYSKVRAITRIAGAHNESALLAIAENGTASHVERTVRYYRKTDPNREREQERARGQHARRELLYFWDHDGCLVLEGRLAPEQGALLIKALEAADEALLAEEKEARAAEEQRRRASAEAAAVVSDDSAEAAAVFEERRWRSRQADALSLLGESALGRGVQGRAAGERHVVQVHVDLEALRAGGDGSERCHVEDGPALARDVARRLACDGGVVAVFEDGEGHALDVGRKTRAVPPAMRRALDNRDQGCRFPGCTCSTRFTDAHHVEHWADGGATKLDNLALLCRFHHRQVHEGGFSVAWRGGELVFTRPDGREVPPVPRVKLTGEVGAGALQRKHAEAGLAIDARTGVPGWMGEAADYTYMLTMLEQREARRTG